MRFTASRDAVTDVWVDGRRVVADGKVLTMDYTGASARLQEAQKRSLSRTPANDWRGRSADEMAPMVFPTMTE